MEVTYDRSQTIRRSINDVEFTLLLTVCLVVMVIFLFLRNISATLIPGVALPLSIIGTFAVMYLLGYSLNNLSLMALTLSVGFVVDDAIVMLENIVRHMEMGEPRMEAALLASKEIGFTIISMTISLVAVFIPVLFMGGIVGRLLHEFAVTIAVAILVSGFVSLTLTPMLGSRFLRLERDRRITARLSRAGERFRRAGALVRQHALRRRCASVSSRCWSRSACSAARCICSSTMPTGFLPSQDSGFMFGVTRAGQDISFDAMARRRARWRTSSGRIPNVVRCRRFRDGRQPGRFLR